jgi:hypothetical protein
MHLFALLALTLGLPSVQEVIDGAEIGPAQHFVAFDSAGKYRSEQLDAKGGKAAVMRGTWTLKDDVVSVKLSSCTGPACKDLKKDYTARIEIAADRAMLVESTAPGALFESGSYYCHYQGCERRVGVELLSKAAKARAVNYLADVLIDKNKPRNQTVVWWGKRLTTEAGKTRIEYCAREEERAKKGAQQVAEDLATLSWIGKLEPAVSADKGCLWDVRVFVADEVIPPSQR